jgi:RNA polymerase sigma factor (sigma-70 family)
LQPFAGWVRPFRMDPPATSETDRALVEAVLARAPGAFERLMRRYQALCWHIINRMVRHPDDARDLCQEAFLRVHLRLHQYRFESALKTWIGQVAYSIAVRHLQRKRIAIVDTADDAEPLALVEQVSDDTDVEAANADAEMAAALHAAIDALPPLPRTVLMLYHFEDASIVEIASITGLATGSIKSILFRSRAKLRNRLAMLAGVFE